MIQTAGADGVSGGGGGGGWKRRRRRRRKGKPEIEKRLVWPRSFRFLFHFLRLELKSNRFNSIPFGWVELDLKVIDSRKFLMVLHHFRESRWRQARRESSFAYQSGSHFPPRSSGFQLGRGSRFRHPNRAENFFFN